VLGFEVGLKLFLDEERFLPLELCLAQTELLKVSRYLVAQLRDLN